MFPDLEHLIALQHLDADAGDARRLIAAHPDLLKAADGRLAEAVGARENARNALKSSQDERRALEKEASVFQGRLTKFRDQQGAVKTNREFQALGHEIETATSDLSAVEEKEIEKMIEADALTAIVKQAEGAMAVRQKEIDAEKAVLAKNLASHQARLAAAEAARAGIVAQISAPALHLYGQIANIRKGVAVCVAADGLCSVCHVRLRPNVYQVVRHNEAIVQCDSCQRILYFVPPPVAPAVADQPAVTAP